MLALQINTTACDGSDMFWPWFLWLLAAFILGIILGWLLSKIFGGTNDTTDYSSKIKSLEADLAACRKEKGVLAATAAATTASLAAAVIPAKAIIPAKADDSIKDDLTKVEGIGPKIKGLLNDDGIWSFKQLSESELSRLQKILDNAGPRYRVHKPKTWSAQAKMAAEGKWTELAKWQDELKGGL
ncbi:hypothetical protein JBL43_13990 [Aureibaculum sp. A20]|uniref:LSU ribosomal protein L21p n=1 Tax=Aureibaculum flavum TaxID=2795986 RepID=A0ABS0WTT2_9FLAO|nr:hypothetical protein [Aureibaculum flavum]MBJ2175360.1 hypothetical protein [Aureibaculum flavum]